MGETKFCKYCGATIPSDAIICTACGRQVENITQDNQANVQPNIVINNANTNVNGVGGKAKSKWAAFFLSFFLGFCGAHKFYEGKVGMGILYIFTGGLFGIGWVIDTIAYLFKPNPYYV